MSAADELRTAAITLRKLATAATPGPWQRPLNTRHKATVTGALPEGERGTWIDGIDPATDEREQCTVAMVPTWSNGRHSRQRGGRDLEYIAALHPGVGKNLADWLDEEAGRRAASVVAAVEIWGNAEHPDAVAWLTTGLGKGSAPALALARLINTGSQP